MSAPSAGASFPERLPIAGGGGDDGETGPSAEHPPSSSTVGETGDGRRSDTPPTPSSGSTRTAGSRPVVAHPPASFAAWRGARVAVTGASGFVGGWVARALAEAGARVSLVVRDEGAGRRVAEALPGEAEVAVCDLAAEGEAARLLRDLRPAAVFSLAGYGVDRAERDEAAAWGLNRDAVAALAEATTAHRDASWPHAALVHAGSALEYGVAGGDLREGTEPRPTTLYGRSKLGGTRALAERAVRSGLPSLTARLFTVYGPGEHPGRLLPSLVEAAATDAPLPLTAGEQRRDFTYVEEVAEGLLRLALAGARPGEAVNLATGRLLPVRAFVERAAEVLGIAPGRLRFGALPTRPEEQRHDPVSTARLAALAGGWRPALGVEAGARRTVERLGESVSE